MAEDPRANSRRYRAAARDFGDQARRLAASRAEIEANRAAMRRDDRRAAIIFALLCVPAIAAFAWLVCQS